MLEYNRFKLNMILESLVNESMFYYSDEFRVVLNRIKDNDIAQSLLKLKGTDVKPDMTFIDVDDKEGFITFSQIKKAISNVRKWSEDYIKVHRDSINVDAVERGIDSFVADIEKGNYIDGDVTQSLKDDIYTKSRNSVKLGKLINSIFPGEYSAKEVEEFVNKYKSKFVDEKKFELVEGEDIVHWYNKDNYLIEDGSIGSSCMRHSGCRNYFKIYTDNVGICQLLIMKDNDDESKIVGRALVWKFTNVNKEELKEATYYMDRVYVCKDVYYEDFKDYAIKNGWAYRTSHGYGISDVTYKGTKYSYVKMEIQLDVYDVEQYPYMDTFKRLDIREGILYNDDDRESDCYLLEDTGGGYKDCSGKWSNYYEDTIPEEEARYSEPLEDYIYADTSVWVDIGHWRYKGYWPDDHEDIIYDEYREEYLHRDNSIYCDEEGTYFYEDDAVECVAVMYGISDYRTDTFSDRCYKVISIDNMSCGSYLEDRGFEESYFHKDLLSDHDYRINDNKYYIKRFEVEVFETAKGNFIDIDCIILGIDKSDSKSYKTDEFTYNYKLETDGLVDRLINKAQLRIDYYSNEYQTKLEFEDDVKYQELMKKRIEKLEYRKNELESF